MRWSLQSPLMCTATWWDTNGYALTNLSHSMLHSHTTLHVEHRRLNSSLGGVKEIQDWGKSLSKLGVELTHFYGSHASAFWLLWLSLSCIPRLLIEPIQLTSWYTCTPWMIEQGDILLVYHTRMHTCTCISSLCMHSRSMTIHCSG